MNAAVRSTLALALVGALMGLSQPVRAEEAAKKSEKSNKHQATGEITAIDTKANTVTIKRKNANMTFALAPDVKYGSGGQIVNLNISNLKVGDKVTVHYTEDAGGKMTAHKIGQVDLSAPKAAAEKAVTTEKKDAPKTTTP
jgi:Cu/Ag efflux protein CusF